MALCEIFKIGEHTDASGKKRFWTENDLEQIVSNFSNSNPDVPICIGHPKQSAPAYGWVNSLKKVGEKLCCDYKQVQNEFKNAVNNGLFKTRSVSIDPNTMTLRHIAFLGAQAPAIKGMEEFCFSECQDEEIIEFSAEDFKFEVIADTLARLRDLLIDKFDLETADKAVSKWSIEDIKKVVEMDKPEALAYAENLENLERNNEVTKIEESNFAQEILAKDSKIADLEKELQKAQFEKKQKEINDFCEDAVSKGNILPAHKEKVVNILQSCSDVQMNFSEGEEKPQTPELLKEFIGGLQTMDFSEVATKTKLDGTKTADFSEYSADEWKNAIEQEINKAKQSGKQLNVLQASRQLKG